jgi:FMN phosphatase YigB (HAD superfamily)/sugar phosphate isomerase/epimerase
MFNGIEVILFDMGGTLRGFHERDINDMEKILQEILDLLKSDLPVKKLGELLADRSKAYSLWAGKTFIELNEQDYWTQWMLPDFPTEVVSKFAIQFNRIWRRTLGTRLVFPETKEVITQLFRNGYRIGLVSNTTTSAEVPEILKELEIRGMIETVILSCNVGVRKPDPRILLLATERLGVLPSRCAYIGDRLDRDVAVTRNAGFAKAVILRNEIYEEKKKYNDPDLQPDAYIDNLSELLSIFPPLNENNHDFRYQSSLSTMWAKGNFPAFSDFFIAAGRLGFPEIELNHQVDSEMLATVPLDRYKISSVHEPCPADIPVGVLKDKDWLISATNEENRIRGVKAVKKSIDLAVKLDASIVVIHCGQVRLDLNLEKRLRNLFETGKKGSKEYEDLKQEYIIARQQLIDGNMAAIKKSLLELLDYSLGTGVKLGLENRYHYFDIPTPAEMSELLDLADSSRLGFVLDVGHAYTLDQLGFFPFQEWLNNFSSRIIEVHIHDVQGITDHFSPGLGDVEFNKLAVNIPKNALRIMELHPINSPEQIRSGMDSLLKKDIIKTYN